MNIYLLVYLIFVGIFTIIGWVALLIRVPMLNIKYSVRGGSIVIAMICMIIASLGWPIIAIFSTTLVLTRESIIRELLDLL